MDGESGQKPVRVAGSCILVSEKTESRNDVLVVIWCRLKDHLLVSGTCGWLWSASLFGAVDMSTCERRLQWLLQLPHSRMAGF